MPKEEHEVETYDVLGLRIPPKRVIATIDVTLNLNELPRRKPHPTIYESEDD